MAENFGWTPQQVREITMYQLTFYICDIKSLARKQRVGLDEAMALHAKRKAGK